MRGREKGIADTIMSMQEPQRLKEENKLLKDAVKELDDAICNVRRYFDQAMLDRVSEYRRVRLDQALITARRLREVDPTEMIDQATFPAAEAALAGRVRKLANHIYSLDSGSGDASFLFEAAGALDVAQPWSCKARPWEARDPPQDCDWPFCGCDPQAQEVLDAIEESGRFVERPSDGPSTEK